MNWKALSPGVSISVCVWMVRGCKSVPSGDAVPDSGLWKSSGCLLITAIILRQAVCSPLAYLKAEAELKSFLLEIRNCYLA